MIQERLIDKEPLVVTVGPVDDGILTEEDGEIREGISGYIQDNENKDVIH